MPKVNCRQKQCVSWDAGRCTADEILIDREGICLTQDEDAEEMVELIEPGEDWGAEDVEDSVEDDEEDDEDWEDEGWPEDEDMDEIEEDDWEEDDLEKSKI